MKTRRAKVDDASQVVEIFKQIFEDMEMEEIEKLGRDNFAKILRETVSYDLARYSYRNLYVVEEDDSGKIVGAASGYPEHVESRVDEAFIESGVKMGFKKEDLDIFTDKEAREGEWYLDSFAVHPDYHHQGIGTTLMNYVKENVKEQGYDIIGLNVDVDNPNAQALYEKKGFKIVGQQYIGKHKYNHMQAKL